MHFIIISGVITCVKQVYPNWCNIHVVWLCHLYSDSIAVILKYFVCLVVYILDYGDFMKNKSLLLFFLIKWILWNVFAGNPFLPYLQMKPITVEFLQLSDSLTDAITQNDLPIDLPVYLDCGNMELIVGRWVGTSKTFLLSFADNVLKVFYEDSLWNIMK